MAVIKLRMTDRDKKFIKFMSETNLVFTNQQIGNIFYKGSTEKSSYMIANRRLRKLCSENYIKKIGGNIGEKDVYYHKKKPKEINHKLTMSEFLSKLSLNGFRIVDVKTEYQGFREKYKIIPDLFITVEYYGKHYIFIVGVDITKNFSNIEPYNAVVTDIKKGLCKDVIYPFIVISICDTKPIKTGACNPFSIKTDMSDFSRLIWAINPK